MKEKNQVHVSTKTVLFVLVILIVDIIVFLTAYSKITHSLYQERSANTIQLMEKITQNVDTVIQYRWNSAHRLANELSDFAPADPQEVQDLLASMKSYRVDGLYDILVIDELGTSYKSTGKGERFQDMSLLLSTGSEGRVFVDREEGPRLMYFLIPLPVPMVTTDTTFTHLCLSYDVSYLDPVFDISQYGEEGAAFIVQSDGPQLYSHLGSPPISDDSHVLSALSQFSYRYGTSYDQMMNDLHAKTGGCACIHYQGESYYIVYQPMATNDWHTMLILPEAQVGSASKVFLMSIITSIGIIGLGAVALLAAAFILTTRRINQEREQITLQLRKAISAERSANQAKTLFLSAMSHDIRTPMNAIVGMTTLAMKNLDNTEYVKNCLTKVTLASNHLLTLINDVLDISRVESGKMSLNPVVFSLADSIANLSSIVRPQINSKNQIFNLRVHNIQKEYLFADELRLNQIFINLLTNAIKYTPSGGTIAVDLYQQTIPGRPDRVRMIFSVEDNGIGMSQEFQKTMYSAFSRSQDTRTNTIQGSGLGLAICKQMVDMMGGTIQCESQEGAGTKFTVTVVLPLAEKLAEDLVLPPMKLLLVDDDPIFLEAGSQTLRDLGLDPDCVGSGEEAILAVEEKHRDHQDYPMVVIDWKMPGMDGIQTTRAIRERVGEDVPIIIISAYERADVEEAALAAGATGFISKPFFRSTVYQNMQQLLNLIPQESQPESELHTSLSGKHLLVAEDNDLNWEIARELLAMYGIHTHRAVNGSECLDMLQKADDGTYTAILMDIQMPVLNGYGAARAIRSSQRPYVRDIPIIAMTADAFSDDIQKCIACGMNGHIAKPINMGSLITLLEKLCKN